MECRWVVEKLLADGPFSTAWLPLVYYKRSDMNNSGPQRKSVIVIGAGAGGMIAAGRAAEQGANVILLEKTDQPGRKILISGKTRCNLTNSRPLEEFIAMYGLNGRFLYSAFHLFSATSCWRC